MTGSKSWTPQTLGAVLTGCKDRPLPVNCGMMDRMDDMGALDRRILATFAVPPPMTVPPVDQRVAELMEKVRLRFYHYFGNLDVDAIHAEINSWPHDHLDYGWP